MRPRPRSTGFSDAWIYIFNKAKPEDFLNGTPVPSGDSEENSPSGQGSGASAAHRKVLADMNMRNG